MDHEHEWEPTDTEGRAYQCVCGQVLILNEYGLKDVKEAIQLTYDELANDVDCSMSTLLTRYHRLCELAVILGGDLMVRIARHCDARLEFFASGAPYTSQLDGPSPLS